MVEVNGTFVDLPDEILDRIRAAWNQCTLEDQSCYQSRSELLTVNSLQALAPEAAPAAAPAADAPDSEGVSDDFVLLPQGTTITNLTGKLNGTSWSISDIQYLPSEESPYMVVEILKRAAFNVTPFINPEKLEIMFQGRFFDPRRGPSVNILGSISVVEGNATFVSFGQFNYPLFAPKIPTSDPNLSIDDPDDGDDGDYDYDDDSGGALPPRTDFEPNVPPPPSKKDKKESQGDAAAMSLGTLLLVLGHLFSYML